MVFVLIGLFLISQCSVILASNSQANEEVLEGYDVIGGLAYTLWEPVDGKNVTAYYEYNTDWQVTRNSYTWKNPPIGSMPSPTSATFYKVGGSSSDTSAIKAWLVRNNTDWDDDDRMAYWGGYPTGDKIHDFIYLRQGYKTGWFHDVLHYKVAVIPFDRILADYEHETNMSVISMNLKHNVTLFVTAVGANFTNDLFNNSVSLGLGVQFGSESVKANSMWTILGQLLTVRLPDVHPVIQFLIAAPFWIGISYVAMVIVRSFIPFLG